MTWFAVENMQYRERARLSDGREGSEGRGRGRRAGEERGGGAGTDFPPKKCVRARE